jgi:hypothetical protein
MIHDVIDAVYKGDYRIEITFDNGKRGVVDFSKYLNRGGVFRKFKSIEFFRRFKVNTEIGTLTWSDELDIAPETLYAQATGAKLPSWMKIDFDHEIELTRKNKKLMKLLDERGKHTKTYTEAEVRKKLGLAE